MNVRSFVTILALAALVAACGGSSSAPGRLRAMNAVQGAARVDLLLDGELAVGSIALPGNSGYQSRAPGSHAASLVASGTSNVVVSATVPLTSGESTTLVASGVLGGAPAPSSTVLLDDDSPPAPGQARLRVVHACAGLAGVDIVATLRAEGSPTPVSPPVLLPFRTGAYLLEFPAGRQSLELLDNGTGLVIATIPTGPLPAGSSSTALVSDPAAGALTPILVSIYGDLP